ncbi:MAG: ribonuclease domain-containing protein [bacterium]
MIPGALTGLGFYGTVGGLTNLVYGDDFWCGFWGSAIFGTVGGGMQGWALAKEMGLNPFWGWFGSVPGPTIPGIPALQQIDPEAIPKTQAKLNAPGKVSMQNPTRGAGESLEGPTTLRLISKGELPSSPINNNSIWKNITGSYKSTDFNKLFSNSAKIFKNNTGVLPTKSLGYYREITVPTPNLLGRQAFRLVVGQGGEVYFTINHYAKYSFIRIK